jgi:hypothetical protein
MTRTMTDESKSRENCENVLCAFDVRVRGVRARVLLVCVRVVAPATRGVFHCDPTAAGRSLLRGRQRTRALGSYSIPRYFLSLS